jgi:hypothetical protein
MIDKTYSYYLALTIVRNEAIVPMGSPEKYGICDCFFVSGKYEFSEG